MEKFKLVQEGLLSIGDASDFLGIGRSSLYQLMDAGKLNYCKIGRSRRIPKRALIELASRNLKGGWALPPSDDEASKSDRGKD